MLSTTISVLIPNYDWDVTALIKALHIQLREANISFEILCFDDAQSSVHHAKNLSLNELDFVTYKVNNGSLGRSKNRNHLAETSCQNFLLFLDGDAGVAENKKFISNYIQAAEEDSVICGGTAYKNHPPENKEFLLRYVYGKTREEKPAHLRQQEPWNGFSAFNFMIPRALFMELTFNNSISEYGHEDTLFGNELKYRCIQIKHIQNAALHLGLDSNSVFLAKTRTGVENLRHLIDAGLIDEDVKLYAWYAKMHTFSLHSILSFLYKKQHLFWEEKLNGPNPSLKLFDFYKLSYLCSLPINLRKPPERKI